MYGLLTQLVLWCFEWPIASGAGSDFYIDFARCYVLFMLLQVRHIMFTWSLTNAIIDSLSDLEQAVTAAVCAGPSSRTASGCSGLLQRLCGWVMPCLPMLTGRNLVMHIYLTLCHDLPQHVKQGWSGELSLL